MTQPQTVEEFEQQYAERSGVTVEFLHEHGRFGAPCDCGDDRCEGWQMTHTDHWKMTHVDHGPPSVITPLMMRAAMMRAESWSEAVRPEAAMAALEGDDPRLEPDGSTSWSY